MAGTDTGAALPLVVCTVVAVKPYSGCYPACHNCRRKLGELHRSKNDISYCCRVCREEYREWEVEWRYCLALSVSDHSAAAVVADVVAFGGQLEPLFGTSATKLHQYLVERNKLCPEQVHHLKEAMDSVLVGRCMGFRFQGPRNGTTNMTLANQGWPLLDLKKARVGGSLIATAVIPLGSYWTPVLAALKKCCQVVKGDQSDLYTNQVPQDLSSVGSSLDDSIDGSLFPTAVQLDSYQSSESTKSPPGLQTPSSSNSACTCTLARTSHSSASGCLQSTCLQSCANRTSNLSEDRSVTKQLSGSLGECDHDSGQQAVVRPSSSSDEVARDQHTVESTFESFILDYSTLDKLVSEWENTFELTDSEPLSSVGPSQSQSNFSSSDVSEDFLVELEGTFDQTLPAAPLTRYPTGSGDRVLPVSMPSGSYRGTPELFSSAEHSTGRSWNQLPSDLSFRQASSPELFSGPSSTSGLCSAGNVMRSDRPLAPLSMGGFVTPTVHRYGLLKPKPRRNLLFPNGTRATSGAMATPRTPRQPDSTSGTHLPEGGIVGDPEPQGVFSPDLFA